MGNKPLSLDIAVATFGEEGIARVGRMLQPPRADVRYVVSWQQHEGITVPEILLRDDVDVLRVDGIGVSDNRNNAISHCRADLIHFADDDIEYLPDSFDRIISAFQDNPSADIALFKAIYPYRKKYPENSCDISLPFPKDYYASSIEIACRRQTAGRLRFNPLLGLGAPVLTSGDDEFFIISAIRRGFHCRFINTTICRHPHFSTGNGRAVTDGVLRSSGCIISIIYPFSYIIRLPLKAWRVSHPSQSFSSPSESSLPVPTFLHALKCLLQGILYRHKIQ